jgi:hypothetical protein
MQNRRSFCSASRSLRIARAEQYQLPGTSARKSTRCTVISLNNKKATLRPSVGRSCTLFCTRRTISRGPFIYPRSYRRQAKGAARPGTRLRRTRAAHDGPTMCPGRAIAPFWPMLGRTAAIHCVPHVFLFPPWRLRRFLWLRRLRPCGVLPAPGRWSSCAPVRKRPEYNEDCSTFRQYLDNQSCERHPSLSISNAKCALSVDFKALCLVSLVLTSRYIGPKKQLDVQ